MKHKKTLLRAIALVLVLGAVAFCAHPLLQGRLFVTLFAHGLEEGMTSRSSLPNVWGIWQGRSRPGAHPMVEFPLGGARYGVYYSPEDVPLAFGNADRELIQNGHQYWEWKGEGDSRGWTQRLREKWFFYEADF